MLQKRSVFGEQVVIVCCIAREQIIYCILRCNTCWDTHEQSLFVYSSRLQHLVHGGSTTLFTSVQNELFTLFNDCEQVLSILWLYLFNSFATKHDRQNRKALKSSQESSSERTECEKLTVPCHSQQRRESFLYKSDSEGEVSPRCMSPRNASFSEGYV